MEVEKNQRGSEVVFSTDACAESVVVRRFLDERGYLSHYELALTLEDEEIEVFRQVYPTAGCLKKLWAMNRLLMAAYEHAFCEYENIAD